MLACVAVRGAPGPSKGTPRARCRRDARMLVPDREPVALRGRDPAPGGPAVRRGRRHAERRARDRRPPRLEAGPHRGGRDTPGLHRGERGRQLHRRRRLDAHLLARQGLDRRPRRAAQAPVAPAHPGQPLPALGRDRHGLHEPQPGRPRRPRVRLHRDPHGLAAKDRRRPRQRPERPPADRLLGARRHGLACRPASCGSSASATTCATSP